MNSLDSRDAFERMLSEALQADAERAPELPAEWLAPEPSSITAAWIDGPIVRMDFDDEQPVGQRRRRVWPLVATAAAVIAIVAALVLVTADDDTTEVPAGPPSTMVGDDVASEDATEAEQIATAFIETRWSDPDTALRYVSDDVTCTAESRCLPETGHPALPTPAETSRPAERLRLEAALFEAIGDKVVNVRCQQQDTSASGITVRCAYGYHTFRSDELGYGPFDFGGPGNYEVYVVRDHEIVSISPPLRSGLEHYFGPIWEDFRIWLSIQHPDDAALMYEGERPEEPLHGIDGWLFTGQSVDLWEQYTTEYATDRAQVGIVGLPPEDAVPSTPDNGELVVRMWTHSPAAPRMRIFVYADGRLITQREGWSAIGPLEGALERHTSYLEQRLTPEGVELVWDYALSSGLFDADDEVVLDVGNVGSACPPILQARKGDQLVRVTCRGGQGRDGGDSSEEATPEQLGWLLRLQERLVDPAKWLPPSAWERYAPTPYVASKYMVCLWGAETSVLPDAAAEVLSQGTPIPHPDDPDNAGCTTLTTEQARTLAAALDDAGMRRDPNMQTQLLFMLVDAAGQNLGNVMFTPYLPHGEAPCIDCG
jgi:hypothetical protein